MYFRLNLLGCIQQARKMKQAQKSGLLKKLDVAVMEK